MNSRWAYFKLSDWSADPIFTTEDAHTPEAAAFVRGEVGQGGIQVLQGSGNLEPSRRKQNGVGVLKVQVVFNQSRFLESRNKCVQFFELLRVIVRLIDCGVHAWPLLQARRKVSSVKEARL